MEIGVAVFAAVIALAALIWQAYEWRRSSARPMVEGLVFRDPDEAPRLRVEIRNVGRSACQVVNVDLWGPVMNGFRTGFDPSQYHVGGDEALPAQIEPGCSLVLDYRASAIGRALAHHGDTQWTCKVRAQFGDGTYRESEGELTLGAHLDAPDEFTVDHGKGARGVAVYGSTVKGRPRHRRDAISRLLRLN